MCVYAYFECIYIYYIANCNCICIKLILIHNTTTIIGITTMASGVAFFTWIRAYVSNLAGAVASQTLHDNVSEYAALQLLLCTYTNKVQ